MSRNFELLSKVYKQRSAGSSLLDRAAPAIPLESASLQQRTASDELRKLVRRVFLFPESDVAPRLVLFAAVDQDSGNPHNWICARVAEMLVDLVTVPICVVDANIHSPSLHQYFGMGNDKGLADAPSESKCMHDLALPLPGQNLWLIPAGSADPSFQNVSAASSLRSIAPELRAGFGFVLINGPPMNLSDEALLLGQLADGIVLLVEAHSTRREAAARAGESLEAANIKLLGVVLTERSYPVPDTLYRLL